MLKKARTYTCLILLLSCLSMSACSSKVQEKTSSFFAMDTYITVTAYGENCEQAVDESREIIDALEGKWSVTDENSEIYKLNNSNSSVEVSDDTADLLDFAMNISEKTKGALDLTIYPVLKLWGFTTDEYHIPDKQELDNTLDKVGFENVELNGNRITLKNGTMLDLGAVAKGYTADRIAENMRNSCVNSALINLGGNIMLVGDKPDGGCWQIGLKNPLGEGNLGVINASDCSVVTSGNYERFFTIDGKNYGHIIDPKTGYPVDNDLLSVTIISESSTLCDALSTALYVIGTEEAVNYWKTNKDFDMMLVTKNGEIYMTPDVDFTLSDDTYHIYSIQ